MICRRGSEAVDPWKQRKSIQKFLGRCHRRRTNLYPAGLLVKISQHNIETMQELYLQEREYRTDSLERAFAMENRNV